MRSYILISVLMILVSGCVSTPEPQENATNLTEPAPSIACEDSDGLNETVSGNVTIGNKSYEDDCDDGSTVREYYCDGTSLGIKQLSCGEGYECVSGACVEEEEEPEPETPERCIETDSGQDYLNYGSVNLDGQLYHDVCQGNYDLLEYFCSAGNLKQATHHCETGERCISGACVPQDKSCSDSDKNTPESKGTTIQYMGGVVTGTSYDECIDEGTRIEYSCDGSDVKNETQDCPSGTYCANGACIALCSDSDSGLKYLTKGTVTGKNETSTDYCKDSTTLVEYYCDGDALSSSDHICEGYCMVGRCLTEKDISCRESGERTYVQYDSEKLLEQNDTCVGYDKVKDYFCDGDEIDYIVSSCEDDELCYSGDCVKLVGDTCYDLDFDDPAGDEHVASMVLLTDNDSVKTTKQDNCLNDITLVEYVCEGDNSKAEYVTCPSDEVCEDGACVYPYTCTETDGGISATPGAATLWDGESEVRTESDHCTGAGDIFETYCEGGRIKYTTLECPSGMACDSETEECEVTQ